MDILDPVGEVGDITKTSGKRWGACASYQSSNIYVTMIIRGHDVTMIIGGHEDIIGGHEVPTVAKTTLQEYYRPGYLMMGEVQQ